MGKSSTTALKEIVGKGQGQQVSASEEGEREDVWFDAIECDEGLSGVKFCCVLISIHSNILAVKKLIQIKISFCSALL